MKNFIPTLTLLLLTTATAFAQKQPVCHNDGPDRGNCGESFSLMSASGPTTSPIAPRTPTDSRFIENGGNGLDTGCTFRPDGPLVITLPVTRVVGDTNGDGTLKFPQQLISNGLITPTVTLRMPAFDVDLEGAPGVPPELDHVLFNGVNIGSLSGSNETWKLNEFTVPIELVRFAQKNSSGAPTPGNNEITIMIDQGSGSDVNWCTAIDWVELSFVAAYPVVFVHGNGSCPQFFSGDLRCNGNKEQAPEQYFITPFLDEKMLVDTSIHMPAALIEHNANTLEIQIPAIASSFGVKHLHVIAHSKGGLHMREFVTRLPSEGGNLGILSLTTLSTPHLGSAGADYQMDAAAGGAAVALFSDNSTLTQLTRQFVPPNPGTPDLRVSAVRAFNARNFPLMKDYFIVDGELNVFHRWTIAADGNLDGSIDQSKLPNFVPTIQANETVGLPPSTNVPLRVTMLQMVYRTLGTVVETSLETRTIAGVSGRGVVEHRRRQFELNDFAVTVESAHTMPNIFRPASFPIFEPANHATISNSSIGVRVLAAIKPLQPRRGQ
jgi:hypothetical protein